MAEQTQTLAILLGASSFPHYPDFAANPAFLNSKRDFRAYLQDAESGLGLADEAILDLFDSHHQASQLLLTIGKFLKSCQGQGGTGKDALNNLLVYYVGHGFFAGQSHEYALALSGLVKDFEMATGLPLAALADLLKEHGRNYRRFVLLDCCFAAEALREFQGAADDALVRKASAAFEEHTPKRQLEVPRQGTTLFCAADKDSVAISPQSLQRTMFSDALLNVLQKGDPDRAGDLTLVDIRDLTWEQLRGQHQKPVRPALHSPDQSQGDIAQLVPLFPNPGYREARAQAEVLARKAAAKAAEEAARRNAEAEANRLAAEEEASAAAHEASLWQAAQAEDSGLSYANYLVQSTRLTHESEARNRLQAIRAKQAEAEALKRQQEAAALAAAETARLAAQAAQAAERQALEKAQAEAAEKAEQEARARQSEQAEQSLWQAAKAGGKAEDYRRYLAQSVLQTYRQEAEIILKALEAGTGPQEPPPGNKRKLAVAVVVVLATVAIGVGMNLPQPPKAEVQPVATQVPEPSPPVPPAKLTQAPQAPLPEKTVPSKPAPQAESTPKPPAPDYRDGQVFQDKFINGQGQGPAMVVIPAGRFDMGSENGDSDEKPVHPVSIARFAMAKTEVTQRQWRLVMGTNPSYFKNCGDDCPVENVSWDDAKAYARRLSELTGQDYRLPSEAQWEYACRAGGKHTYCGGADLGQVAWYDGNAQGSTKPVGRKQANAFGLFDMSGNVWEWVEDCYRDSYQGALSDGRARGGSCEKRVLRGGSWFSGPRVARSANRLRSAPADRDDIVGFRLARMLP